MDLINSDTHVGGMLLIPLICIAFRFASDPELRLLDPAECLFSALENAEAFDFVLTELFAHGRGTQFDIKDLGNIGYPLFYNDFDIVLGDAEPAVAYRGFRVLNKRIDYPLVRLQPSKTIFVQRLSQKVSAEAP